MLIFLSMLETDIEQQQFLELYERYGNAMLLVARKFFEQDYGLAEDAVQNTRVVENFSKIQAVPCKKRGAYLVIIVRNEAISIIRKRRKEIPLNEAIVGEEFDIEDSSQPILDIIHKMPELYRAVLEMRFVEECNTREIAKKLNLTESTVNTRIHRGRILLMKKLEEEGYAV